MKISRRKLVGGTLAGLSAAVLAKALKLDEKINYKRKPVSGKIIGASAATGHKLRQFDFPKPTTSSKKDIVIVGGGIAALATAKRLANCGVKNFTILELEDHVGGNSSSGKNAVSEFPWGAHYVPLLSSESKAVIKLFEELGIITGYNAKGLPIYNEYYTCFEPQERLYIYGKWQEDLIPTIAISEVDHEQYKRFFSYVNSLKNKRGSDNKILFAIPLDMSSQDKNWLKLDQITMRQWLQNNGYDSKYLQWYVNYCCRDDYGTDFKEVSAWAALHYFAARNGQAANVDSSTVITWPQGNGWLVQKLSNHCKDNIENNALVYRVEKNNNRVSVYYYDNILKQSKLIEAKTVVMATPRFITSRLVDAKSSKITAKDFSYSPWVVANITLSELPQGRGQPLSWDNVVYNSKMLGYVVATHQITEMNPIKTVITYYWPLSHTDPAQARQEALAKTHQDWQEIILEELYNIHPELDGKVENIDICLWGHAMVRPTASFIWGNSRRQSLKQQPPIFTAHSDMSGISIFEEAYTHGVRAAENVMSYLQIPFSSIL